MRNFKILTIILIVSALFSLTSCIHNTPIGEASVILQKYGSDKGIQPQAKGPGTYFESFGQNYYNFPTYQVNWTFTADKSEGSKTNEEFTFQTSEGMVCAMDLGLAMHFDFNMLPKMYAMYHQQVDEIRGVVVRNSIRDALNRVSGNMPVESVYGAGKGILIDSVFHIVRANLASTGIIIDRLYLIGAIRIPQSIKNALDAKVAMTQQAQEMQNAVAKATAQANINIATAKGIADAKRIQADGEAYYNRTVAGSLTPAIIEAKRIEKWNGVYPVTYGLNGGLLIK